jgi:hypothetical protein
MKQNVGNGERVVRVILGLIAFALGYYYHSWWGLFGFIPFLTGLIGWCPIYAAFKFSTHKMKEKK